MRAERKRVEAQVIVTTGTSSGIGLTTACAARGTIDRAARTAAAWERLVAETHNARRLGKRGRVARHVVERSFHTPASLHPLVTGAVIAGAELLVTGMLKARN